MEGEGGKCKKNLARVQYKGNKEDGGRCPVTSSRGRTGIVAFYKRTTWQHGPCSHGGQRWNYRGSITLYLSSGYLRPVKRSILLHAHSVDDHILQKPFSFGRIVKTIKDSIIDVFE